MTVTRNTPNTGDTFSGSQPVLLANAQGYFDTWQIDHIPYNVANAGFHAQVTLPIEAAPTSSSSQVILYAQDSVATTGRSDLYMAYQTSAGTPFSGTLFPLNLIKAFGRATKAGNLVVGSSFNVTTAVYSASPDTYTIDLASPICKNTNADKARVMVLALPESSSFNANVTCMSLPVTSTTQVIITTNSSTVTAISFAILVI